jgi:hypothetical protein
MDLKNYEWQSDFAKSHIAEGEAKSVLLVLKARGLAVPDHVHERITGCSDTDQLERWIQRAATIDHAEQLFD